MAKFLNTQSINEWIPKLINSARRELVIIVPYIKTSKRLHTELVKANERGVETIIVYRELSLNEYEKEKLLSIDNLNLMHHPNVHAKCYMNEDLLIISSMNMYEFSAQNNREMGILLHLINIEESTEENPTAIKHSNSDGNSIFQDAVFEIRDIINGATMERPSRETVEEGFEVEIIKTDEERTLETCAKLNKVFVHKKFTPQPIPRSRYFMPTCTNYFDHLDLSFTNRAELKFTYPEERVSQIFDRFKTTYQEYRFTGFKFYWNYYKSILTLYPDKNHAIWKNKETITDEEYYSLMRQGIDDLVAYLRQFI